MSGEEAGTVRGRRRVGSGAPWEARYGYSRAVRVGRHVYVAGTAPVGPDGSVVGKGDPYRQTLAALDIIERALRELGATLEDVVRTRIYVTDIARSEEVGRAHGERFGAVRPATSMVQVAALIDPAMMVEVEADAVLGPTRRARRPPASAAPPAESL